MWKTVDEEFKTMSGPERDAWRRGTARGIVFGFLLGMAVLALCSVLAGCGGMPEGIPAEPTIVQPPAQSTTLCFPTDPAPITEVDQSCPRNWTRDGRECMVCTHYSACEFINPESGYCVDLRYGCADPACAFGIPK